MDMEAYAEPPCGRGGEGMTDTLKPYEAEKIALKQELDCTHRRLKESDQLLNETRKELEELKKACSEMEHELLRCEGRIATFEFVVRNGR